MPRYIGSKWRKTNAILRSKSLQQIVPRTTRLNRTALAGMLEKYKMVYIKPDTGSHGKGVMRVEKWNGQYRYQAGKVIRTFPAYDAMYNAIHLETRGRRYLIQKGIHLLTYKGRRFDLRVMAQLNPHKRWETTGIIGRVAAPQKIVTNYHNGGKLMTAATLLSGHVSKAKLPMKIRSLEKLGVLAGSAMRRTFPDIIEIGLDIGLDHTLTPWILEVNTRPDPYIFRRLSNPAIFRKIRHYTQQNLRRR